ncbi:WAT1-related protein [Hibiscus syriacus]|uniref:WAT1-related protein n=1 Tax=Hibiscus syriacus TaxID=106335 RepID=A0A6A3A5S1_HIBSY|nr:WAT1-related protein At5g40240-like [Hibiscus syriacus]KAE8699670.1 WAT1-related protein [Hibiscus syriacus]
MEVLPSLAMVGVEFSNVVISILFKAASLKGLSYYSFVAYCYVLGTLVFTILVLFRKTVFPPLKFPLVSRLCLFAVTGYLGLMCAYKGIDLGSPTLASAINNLTPAFTFILAVSFRMEKVELIRAATQAKIIGTITSISGALVITFYKGPLVIPSSSSSSSSVLQLQRPLESSQSNWIIGGILEAIAYLLYSCCYILMAQIMKIYPEEIVVTFFFNLSVALLALPVCFMAQPQLSSWSLTDSVSVVAVLYTGLFGFSFSSCTHTWGVRLKGPVFVAIFRPTSIVIAAVMSATLLGEALYLGSVIGAVIITGGLYAVLWGKAKEAEEMRDEEPCGLSPLRPLRPSSSDRVPLLQSYKC